MQLAPSVCTGCYKLKIYNRYIDFTSLMEIPVYHASGLIYIYIYMRHVLHFVLFFPFFPYFCVFCLFFKNVFSFIIMYGNNQHGDMICPDMKPCYVNHRERDYCPITARPGVFYPFYTTAGIYHC